ncbi:MAG: glutamate synthase large subunit [Deltaproteobacteria bacterium]|nr:glutamate synthase large subunit [Deltaproteobacteria bacterium]
MPLPQRQGLYDPSFERDACGLGFVATLNKEPTHQIVLDALEILRNLTHRGAAGSDPKTGDGAGILLQIPDAFYREELKRKHSIELPSAGNYAVITCFLSQEPSRRRAVEAIVERAVLHYGQKIITWRDIPINTSALGPIARSRAPFLRHLFVERKCTAELFDATMYMIRNRASSLASEGLYIASCSARTVIYKGLMLAEQLSTFYKDLEDQRTVSKLAMVHSRFSTNTFPSWELAHPYRLLAHNGEINTLRGNKTWMEAREWHLKSDIWKELVADFRPIVRPGASDSGAFDNVADFLFASGRSLPHVMMMMVPEAWNNDVHMSDEKKAFYEYHGCLIEPWDGPAALGFTDGRLIGATLDRNGLRPAKYVVTSDGIVILASEHGVLTFDPTKVMVKGRLQPGKMFLVNTEEGRIVSDEEIKREVASRRPYRQWLNHNKIELEQLPTPTCEMPKYNEVELEKRKLIFGYTQESERMLLTPMAINGEEPVGSMGTDIPLAVLSRQPQILFSFFKQHFAQVTNPAIDPVREEVVMSLVSQVGGEGNLLEETPRQCRMLGLPHPYLTNLELAKLRDNPIADFTVTTIDMLFKSKGDPEENLKTALDDLCEQARVAVTKGTSIIILSDRKISQEYMAIPTLLALGAVHHSLMRKGLRVRCGIVVETGEAHEMQHMALLVGYGAGAINPYLAFDTVEQLARQNILGAEITPEKATQNLTKAFKKGLLKVMAKMGISTLSSYQGAQIFEAIGLDQLVIDTYFTGTTSRIRGIGLTEIAEDALARHNDAFSNRPLSRMRTGASHHYRRTGEYHLWHPESVASLQKAVQLSDKDSYDRFAKSINEQQPSVLRSLWDFKPINEPIAIEEVETAKEIVKRFVTGAMSFGSISKEAHESLAVAMNRIGARSNSGEGGEDSERFKPDANGNWRRSSIKQVASGRFGVTVEYLVNADDLQIKVAQGAKPGEGGQLPGHKVNEVIAKVRHSTPGVTLISPPPHHDIYSIEDLAQLIFDLKNVNPQARISVKLVSEAGVGIVAAGVAKAHADVIIIAGHDGGTGASPLTSIYHAGVPWELGIAETQQVLLLNNLRGRVRLQVDGQMRTGRDVIMAALLGAEEFGFSTAPLIANGCVMMRKCHLNTCPVGIATQDPVLRARFRGSPENVVRYFFFVAEEVRTIMASLGVKHFADLIGRVEQIVPKTENITRRQKRIDFSEVLYKPTISEDAPLYNCESQDHGIDNILDHKLIDQAKSVFSDRKPVKIDVSIRNSNRTFGTMLSSEVVKHYADEPLTDDTIVVNTKGTAGQSFGAFLASGITLNLEGDANDYVGKGLSGGILALKPPAGSPFKPEEQVIAGNTVLYGATSGKAFFNGRAGERFAVRNSGSVSVVEGVGDHGCEYMTGGTVIVLGATGRNFGAGMSGGVAYIFDLSGEFKTCCHPNILADIEKADENDLALVRGLLEEHVQRTQSPLARDYLNRFTIVAEKLLRIIPSEYRQALKARSAA